MNPLIIIAAHITPTTARNFNNISNSLISFSSISGRPSSVGSVRFLDDLIRSDLQALRHSYFVWLLICTGIVAIGVLFEYAESLPIPRVRMDCVNRLYIPQGEANFLD
jgi:hypothetical protein